MAEEKKRVKHTIDVELAVKYGIKAALLLDNLIFWLTKNLKNKKNIHDGYVWTFNSIKAFAEVFPEMSEKEIRTALEKLEVVGVIKTGNYNKFGFDHTKWYTIVDESIFPNIEPKNSGEPQTSNSLNPLKSKLRTPKSKKGFLPEGKPLVSEKDNAIPITNSVTINSVINPEEGNDSSSGLKTTNNSTPLLFVSSPERANTRETFPPKKEKLFFNNNRKPNLTEGEEPTCKSYLEIIIEHRKRNIRKALLKWRKHVFHYVFRGKPMKLGYTIDNEEHMVLDIMDHCNLVGDYDFDRAEEVVDYGIERNWKDIFPVVRNGNRSYLIPYR